MCVILICDTCRGVVQSLNSPFFPPHIGAEPGRAKGETLLSAPMWGGKKGEFRDWTSRGETQERSVAVARGAAGSSSNPGFLSAFRTSQEWIKTKRNRKASMITSSELLPVTALRAWDQETTLLWLQSFDLFF